MEFPGAPESSNPPKKSDGIGAVVFLILFSLPFAGFGIFALVEGVKKFSAGDTKNGLGLCAFGLVFSLVGFGLTFGAIYGRKKTRQAEEAKRRDADHLWLLRPDWAAGRIKSTAAAQIGAYVFMGLVFGGMGLTFTFLALPKELPKGNYAVLLVLLFPIVGFGFLITAIRAWIAHRRFGDCFFELAQIPTPLGGTLEGMVQTGARLRLEHGLHLKLSCIRQVTTGSGKSRSTREYVLWQDEKIFRPEADLPEAEPGHTGIPIFFKLPADQPEATPDKGDGVHWRLDARAKMSGPDFRAQFEVPVFQVAGAVITEPADEPDPTAALQMPVEELRRDEGSKILVTDGPGGREFYFPAARNIGTTLYLTLMFLIWTAFTLATYFLFKSLFFEIVFTTLDVLIFFACFNRWFKSSRININPNGVCARNRWLIFNRSKNFTADDIHGIELKLAFNVGSHAFYSLQLVLPSGKTAVIATDLPDKLEAEWLVREMTKTLGRKI